MSKEGFPRPLKFSWGLRQRTKIASGETKTFPISTSQWKNVLGFFSVTGKTSQKTKIFQNSLTQSHWLIFQLPIKLVRRRLTFLSFLLQPTSGQEPVLVISSEQSTFASSHNMKMSLVASPWSRLSFSFVPVPYLQIGQQFQQKWFPRMPVRSGQRFENPMSRLIHTEYLRSATLVTKWICSRVHTFPGSLLFSAQWFSWNRKPLWPRLIST